MKNIIKNISFCIFMILFSKAIFCIFINDFAFFNFALFSMFWLFLYLFLSKQINNFKINKNIFFLVITGILTFYSFNIYKIYYKKPTEFIQNIISIKDNEILKLYVNNSLSEKNYNQILDFFEEQNFKIYIDKDITNFYLKDIILGKKYAIDIRLSGDSNVSNIYIFTGYNAN